MCIVVKEFSLSTYFRFRQKKERKNNLSLQKNREKVGLKYSLKALKQR